MGKQTWSDYTPHLTNKSNWLTLNVPTPDSEQQKGLRPKTAATDTDTDTDTRSCLVQNLSAI